MKPNLRRILAATALTAAILAVASAPAWASSSGACTKNECGQVINNINSPASLTMKRVGSTGTQLAPGFRTNVSFDWDAVLIPRNHCITYTQTGYWGSTQCAGNTAIWMSIRNIGVGYLYLN